MKKDISMIAPQYGSIINKDIKENISALMKIRCGTFFTDIKIDVAVDKWNSGYMQSIFKTVLSALFKRRGYGSF